MIELNKKYSHNIYVIGVGGTGSHLVSFLTQLLSTEQTSANVNSITFIDGDEVELKNTRNQKFLPRDIGKNKAEVLSDRYSLIYNKEFKYIDNYIIGEHSLYKIMSRSYRYSDDTASSEYNTIISCVDNNKARQYIEKMIGLSITDNKSTSNYIYIDAGNSSGADNDLTGQIVVSVVENREVIAPLPSTYFPQILEEEVIDPTLSCQEVNLRNIQHIGANITSATNVFNVVNDILNNHRINNTIITWDATNMTSTSYN